jgi:hypothetical protein
MSRKKRKLKPGNAGKMRLPSQLKGKVPLLLTVTGLIVSIAFNVHSCVAVGPQLQELEKIKHDFPMVGNIYEAIDISMAIPLPEPLEPTENLDYFPSVLMHCGPEEAGYFESTTYGYALRLITGNNTYLAMDPSEESIEKTPVFSMGELREKRNRLRWFLYDGPWPPEEWTALK